MSVIVEVEAGVMLVRFVRPERRNAIDLAAVDALCEAWDRFDSDTHIGAVVVIGTGSAFTSGADLQSLVPRLDEQEIYDRFLRACLVGRPTRKPIVAAVNGACMGSGFLLLLGTDVRIAAPTATFGTEATRRRGRFPAASAGALFAQVPYSAAMDLALCERRLDAQEALRIGLISAIHPLDRLLDHCLEVARRIATFDQESVIELKRLALERQGVSQYAAMRIDSRLRHSLIEAPLDSRLRLD